MRINAHQLDQMTQLRVGGVQAVGDLVLEEQMQSTVLGIVHAITVIMKTQRPGSQPADAAGGCQNLGQAGG